MNKTVLQGRRSGAVRIPSSKSVVHRLLICAALGSRDSIIRMDGLSKDILATVNCLRALGAEIEAEDRAIEVRPIDILHAEDREAVLPTGESGSTLRFLLPLAGALGRSAVFEMQGRLSERPLAPFDRVLTEHGMCIRREGQRLRCSGQLQGGRFVLPGNVSSQYFTGLLLALPLLRGESSVKVDGILESADYVRLTEEVLQLSGIRLDIDGGAAWHIPGGQRPALPHSVKAEGDWSNAAFFLCIGALSENGVEVGGLNPSSGQGDRNILRILKEFGAEVSERENGAVCVRRGRTQPITIDASAIPDLVPVLAVLCCAAEGRSEITGAARLRLKESDRLHTTKELIRALGGAAEEQEDGLIIHGTGKLNGGTADACGDHRIAMSAAAAACICSAPVTVTGAECVEKSYPAFWRDYEGLHRED